MVSPVFSLLNYVSHWWCYCDTGGSFQHQWTIWLNSGIPLNVCGILCCKQIGTTLKLACFGVTFSIQIQSTFLMGMLLSLKWLPALSTIACFTANLNMPKSGQPIVFGMYQGIWSVLPMACKSLLPGVNFTQNFLCGMGFCMQCQWTSRGKTFAFSECEGPGLCWHVIVDSVTTMVCAGSLKHVILQKAKTGQRSSTRSLDLTVRKINAMYRIISNIALNDLRYTPIAKWEPCNFYEGCFSLLLRCTSWKNCRCLVGAWSP